MKELNPILAAGFVACYLLGTLGGPRCCDGSGMLQILAHSPGERRREMKAQGSRAGRGAVAGEPRIRSEGEGVLCGDSLAKDWQRGPKKAYGFAHPPRVPVAAAAAAGTEGCCGQGYTLHLPCLVF